MGKGLIITEKPSVARDIVAALGGFVSKDKDAYWESDDYVCTYAVGHILTLQEPEDINPEFKRWRLSDLPIIPNEFVTKELESQKQRIRVIKNLMVRKDVDVLINACDAAREGELIFREIVKHLKSEKPVRRLWLQSMTKDAICNGFKSLADGKLYEGLAAAAECRSYADWLIGMNATRALTIRLKTRTQRGASWSAGRVQTPTLALLVNRELEILSHVPRPYWKIEGEFAAKDHKYPGTWFDPNFKKDDNDPDLKEDRIFNEDVAKKIVAMVTDKTGTASETRKAKPRKAPQLFDLTTLQKEANRRFGWSAARTLRAAQRCYETHKVLTYPRTSSRSLPNDYVAEVERVLDVFQDDKNFGPFAKYLIKNGRKNDNLVFNDAGVSDHFAIIPTGQLRDLEGDDAKLYDLVARTFLAAFYPPAIYEEIERITIIEGQYFRSKPPMLLKEPGWQAVFEKEATKAEDRAYPPLVAGQDNAKDVKVEASSINSEPLETKPPGRIGEASLLSLMENAGRQVEDEELASALMKAEGLGTAATRADIIENLKVKEYVDQGLRPTVKGIRLIDILHRIKASRLTSAELTARLELQLNQIEKGESTAKNFLGEIKQYTQEVVDAARGFDFDQIYPDSNPLGKCPKCKVRDVYERAWFYGCTESTKRSDEKKTCTFLIWKDFKGRYIDRQTVRILLEQGITRELDGFTNQYGNSYKAVLALENGQVVERQTEQSKAANEAATAYIVNPDPLGACPIHKGTNCQVIETGTEFVCTMRKAARETGEKDVGGMSLPRSVCRRELRREEVMPYITNGVTEMLPNFISKKNRPFSARLRLQQDGGFTFEFPERAPRGKKKAEGAATEEAAT